MLPLSSILLQSTCVSRLFLPYTRRLAVNMNGLRALAAKRGRRFFFEPDTNEHAATIEVLPDLDEPGKSDWSRRDKIDQILLAGFLERGEAFFRITDNENQGDNTRNSYNYGAKLVMVAARAYNLPFINESILQDPINNLNPDPLFNRIFHVRYDPSFEVCGSIANGGTATMQLHVDNSVFMLSIRQNDEDTTFDSRCLALWVPVPPVDGPPRLVDVDKVLDFLKDLKEEAHSPLYLPFAITAYAVHHCRNSLGEFRGHITNLAKKNLPWPLWRRSSANRER